MSLDNLSARLREFCETDPRARGLTAKDCARLVLFDVFAVEPTLDEVLELVNATGYSSWPPNLIAGNDSEEDARSRQTGGGRRILPKSQHLAG